MQTFKAKVKFPAKEPKEGKFGPYISVGVIPFGEQDTKDNVVNIYGNPDDDYMKSLKWKDEVTVLNDNGKHRLLQETQPTNGHAAHNGHDPRPAVGLTTMNKDEKLQLDAELQAYAKLHGRCWELAANSFPDGALPSDETIQKVATTLFIQVVRKYAL